MPQNNEKIDQYLNNDVPGEQPNPGWKLSLIETMEQEIDKTVKTGESEIKTKSKNRPLMFALSGLVAVIAFLAVTIYIDPTGNVSLDNPQPNELPSGDVSLWHVPIATDWELKNVRFEFSEDIEWREQYNDYELVADLEFNRAVIDPIAAQIDPDALSGEITQTDREIRYQVNGKTISFWKESMGPNYDYTFVQYSIYLFETPEGNAYSKQDREKISSEEQQKIVEQYISEHPELNIIENRYFQPNYLWGPAVEAVQVIVDDDYSYDAMHATFYDGKLYCLDGKFIHYKKSESKTNYGTIAEVEEYLNHNPKFFVQNSAFPDVEIKYLITDVWQTNQGLMAQFELQNPDETLKALKIKKLMGDDEEILSHQGTLYTLEDQIREMGEVDAIREIIKNSETQE